MNIFGNFANKRGASESQILEAEASTGLKFPVSYKNFIRKSNGLLLTKQEVTILSLEKSLDYFVMLRDAGITQTWGYFPILDNEDSNPWCMCCKNPLTGYIVQVMHDDAAQIKFRNIESFVSAIDLSDRNDASLLDDLDGDFRSIGSRTGEDLEAARALIKSVPTYKHVDRSDACRFAMWLFGEDQVNEIAPFLDDEDPFVARDALERLNTFESTEARTAILAAQKNLADFVQKSLGLLKQVGIEAQLEQNSIVRVHPGVLLDMKIFYAQRNAPGAEEKFIERVRFFIAKKENPNR